MRLGSIGICLPRGISLQNVYGDVLNLVFSILVQLCRSLGPLRLSRLLLLPLEFSIDGFNC